MIILIFLNFRRVDCFTNEKNFTLKKCLYIYKNNSDEIHIGLSVV